MPEHGGLQSAEAEIQIPLGVGPVAIGMGEPSRREGDCAIVSASGQTIHDRPTRISESQQLGHLVERLPCCVVARAAQERVMTGSVDQIEAGMSTRNNQHHGWKWDLAVFENKRLDMSGQV